MGDVLRATTRWRVRPSLLRERGSPGTRRGNRSFNCHLMRRLIPMCPPPRESSRLLSKGTAYLYSNMEKHQLNTFNVSRGGEHLRDGIQTCYLLKIPNRPFWSPWHIDWTWDGSQECLDPTEPRPLPRQAEGWGLVQYSTPIR